MSRCEICGKMMPAGEEMFKFHGYSGPCPKPPLVQPPPSMRIRQNTDVAMVAVAEAFRQNNASAGRVAIENLMRIVQSEQSQTIATLQAEIARLKDHSAWQDIATAPKDGSWFLAWDYDGGYYTYRMGPGFITGEDPQPTDWMPLPNPPLTRLPEDE